MIRIIESIMLVMMIVLAIVTVSAIKLRRAIIYMGSFSLISSFVYLVCNAPDVAIAEAVIGCTISVILLLTALKKYRIMTIYYVEDNEDALGRAHCEKYISQLELFLVANEFEPQIVKTSLDDDTLHEQDKFDLLVVNQAKNISVFSAKDNLNTKLVAKYIKDNKEFDNVEFIPLVEEADYEG